MSLDGSGLAGGQPLWARYPFVDGDAAEHLTIPMDRLAIAWVLQGSTSRARRLGRDTGEVMREKQEKQAARGASRRQARTGGAVPRTRRPWAALRRAAGLAAVPAELPVVHLPHLTMEVLLVEVGVE